MAINKLRKGNNLWWIAALAVMGFLVCACVALTLKYLFPAAPTALPSVPIYIYNTPTPLAPNYSLLTGAPPNVIYVTATPAPSSTPLPTATSSFLSWIFPFYYGQPPENSYIPPQPAPLEVVVITLTPSFPSPPPQPTANPRTCKNILYPARPGSQWNYYVRTPRRQSTLTLHVVAVEGSQAAVDMTLADGDSARMYVQCDQDVILNFPLLNARNFIGDMNSVINMDYVGGVLAPNEAAFTSDNWALSWVTQYRVSGNGTVEFKGRDFTFTISPSNVRMTCQTLGAGNTSFETLTVAAGTFNALKVICRAEGQATGIVNGSQVTGTITAQSTQWFAPNIGLLKLQSDYAYFNAFGISLPLSPGEVGGYLELRSYIIGQ